MNYVIKPFIIAVIVCSFLLLSKATHAQTLAKNGVWLENQFSKLMTDKEKGDIPRFTFKGCQMNMALDSQDKDVSVGMNMAWQLKDIRRISYKQEKEGQYTLLLDVPADKVRMAMNMSGFSGSFDTNGKDSKNKDNNTTLSLNTHDESLVKQIKQKLEESVKLCRQGKE